MSKTKIKSHLLLASRNAKTGTTLYTWRLVYPRIILSELLTHRVFSRNTSSSRAIPAKKNRRNVWKDPFVPTYIGEKQSGMQAGKAIVGWRYSLIRTAYALARYPALAFSWVMELFGAPKQIVNRVLEPWMWVSQIVSSTEVENFLKQRNHQDAEPHFHELASQMYWDVRVAEAVFKAMSHAGTAIDFDEFTGTRYQVLMPGEWHIPHLMAPDRELPLEKQLKVSSARSARESYTTIDGRSDKTLEEELAIYQKLISSDPMHPSPLEHAAEAQEEAAYFGNFCSFKQYRKQFKDEAGGDFSR